MEKTTILNMSTGPEMDKLIADVIFEISGEKVPLIDFTTDQKGSAALWQFATDAYGDIGICKFASAPKLLSQFCKIQDDEDEGLSVTIITGNWMESLAKAVLLFHYGHFGDYCNDEWRNARDSAPIRYPH